MVKKKAGKKMKKFSMMVVFLGSIGFVTISSQAASVYQSLSLGGFQVSLNGQEGGGQGGDGVWLSAEVASSIHLVEYVSATFYHPNESDDNEWGWSASFGGIKNSDLVLSPVWSSASLSVGGVSLNQSTQLFSENGYERGWASVTIDPSQLEFAYMNYYEWYDEYINGVRWNAHFTFRGNFGDGELGEARGREYFGLTPEPATMALIGPAVLFFARRRL